MNITLNLDDLKTELIKPFQKQVNEVILCLKTTVDNISQNSTNNKQCFECGSMADHEHHVIPQSVGGTKTIPLCPECHGKAHSTKISSSALIRLGINRARMLGQKFGRPQQVDRTLVILKREQGLSLGAIAKDLRCSKAAVHKILKAHNQNIEMLTKLNVIVDE